MKISVFDMRVDKDQIKTMLKVLTIAWSKEYSIVTHLASSREVG